MSESNRVLADDEIAVVLAMAGAGREGRLSV
jgi:hypothetical protein